MAKKILYLIIILLLIEGSLRFFWGFGTPPLYISDPDYEYMFAPNQEIHRFGHHLITNNLCMRNDALATDDSVRILIFGDSVINGGIQTDNDDLATTILEKRLSKKLNKKVRVLNISAGSWGPDNAFAYLKKHGNFDAQMIVMVFSSHDIYDVMHFEKLVGVNVAYPQANPKTAIGDCVFRYLVPEIKAYISGTHTDNNNLMINKKARKMNSGWGSFIDYASTHQLPLLVYLHAQRNEVEMKQFNQYGQTIINYLDSANVDHITDINIKMPDKVYRDFIHFNKQGQLIIANKLETPILNTLSKGFQ